MGYNNQPNVIVQIDNKAIREQQEKADRQTQVINQGVSLITADQTTPLDLQVEGRTLVPLQNSNLEGGGTYVLANADKKSKVIVDNKVSAGVAKLTKNSTLARKANFAGKATGNTTDNPNISKHNSGAGAFTGLYTPSAVPFELGTAYSRLSTLNNDSASISTSNNGTSAQILFSFDLIAEVERNMGRIPGADTAAKVQWLKDNLLSANVNWHGFGSGAIGNKVSLSVWGVNTSSWILFTSHTSGAVTLIQGYTNSAGAIAARIDANGFIHFLAHSEVSDGVTASVVNTDFIELLIDLKTTAILDTRPQVIRVGNFEGKVAASTAENPHVSKGNSGSTTLQTPSGSWAENTQAYNDAISKLDGSLRISSTTVNGNITQQIFSFDVIAEVERNMGRIPSATVPGKIQWLKDNVSRIVGMWSGYGSSPAGYKATLSGWNNNSSAWYSPGAITTNSFVTSLTFNPGSGITNYFDANGFIHYVVFSEPTDGVTTSTIFSDYVEIEITLKPGAVLHDPQVPLYQVDSADYTKILGEWPEAEVLTRYPKTTGIQHVQNPYIMAEGENLLPPLYEWEDNSSGKATILEPYKVKLTQAVAGQRMTIYIPAIEGQTYTYSANRDTANGLVYFYFCDAAKNRLVGGVTHKSGTAPAGTKLMEVILNPDAPINDYIFSNPMMVLGPVEKPFVPKNPSYLFTQVKLGQVGSAKDVLYKQDGWKVKKLIEKDMIIDGSLNWNTISNLSGLKTCRVQLPAISALGIIPIVTKYNGAKLTHDSSLAQVNLNGDEFFVVDISGVHYLYFGVANTETGFTESFVTGPNDWKAYFNGWQVKTVDGSGNPTAWRSFGDGTDAPTQTIAYVVANKAPNYTPYKLSYALKDPVTEDVSDKVEGDISAAGITQVEVGSGVIVREKVTPQLNGDGTYKIGLLPTPSSLTKLRVGKFLKVFTNGIPFTNYTVILNSLTYGNERITIQAKDYDPAAEYKVTYLALDRDKLTVNPYNAKVAYAKNIRSALEDTVKKVEDNTKDISVNVQAVAELYRRMKSMGG